MTREVDFTSIWILYVDKMHKIEKVSIKSLWGARDFTCDFDGGCNFLIGKNGCGKTTIINLISAALGLDFATLESIDFEEVHFRFKSPISKSRPEIKVVKIRDSANLYSEIKYLIRHKATDEFKEYELGDADQRILIIGTFWSKPQSRRIADLDIATELRKILKVTWLPIQRYSIGQSAELMTKEISAPIDAKINDLSNRFVRYFSALGSQVKELENKVQKSMMLSLLSEEGANFKVSPNVLDQEKEGLKQIFKNFGIAESDYQDRLDRHFELAREALQQLAAPGKPSSMKGLPALFATFRIGYVVEEWNKFLEMQKTILKGRSAFIEMLNSLIDNKKFSVNPANELVATLREKVDLPLVKLSSGEKQLLIMLGEALLQNASTCLYIADEPELSLHVDWQESLVTNILELNPNAQIIFATHSPDIVGTYDSHIKDVADLLK